MRLKSVLDKLRSASEGPVIVEPIAKATPRVPATPRELFDAVMAELPPGNWKVWVAEYVRHHTYDSERVCHEVTLRIEAGGTKIEFDYGSIAEVWSRFVLGMTGVGK